jgi:hypothetical protein
MLLGNGSTCHKIFTKLRSIGANKGMFVCMYSLLESALIRTKMKIALKLYCIGFNENPFCSSRVLPTDRWTHRHGEADRRFFLQHSFVNKPKIIFFYNYPIFSGIEFLTCMTMKGTKFWEFLWCAVQYRSADVLEAYTASIFKVEEQTKYETSMLVCCSVHC